MPRSNDPESDAIIGNTFDDSTPRSPNDSRTLEQYWVGLRQDPLLSYYVEIARMLRQGPNAQALIDGLKRLEADTVALIAARVGKKTLTPAQALQEKKYRYHVLTEVLFAAEPQPPQTSIQAFQAYMKGRNKLFGKPAEPDPPVPTMVGFQTSQQFRAFIAKGLHFKDPLVPASHGEFTHHIQWYLLTRAWPDIQRSVGTKAPVTSATDVYKSLASYAEITRTGRPVELTGLWDALVDRIRWTEEDWQFLSANGRPDTADWRCPDALQAWLVSPAAGSVCPTVSLIVDARQKKRAAMPDLPVPDDEVRKSAPGWNVTLTAEQRLDFSQRLGYLAEKYYSRKRWDELKPQQKAWLATLSGQGRIDTTQSPP
jgi:hypothetical protein